MFKVLGCLVGQHDLWLVGVAAVLCLFASTTAVSMLGRARAAEGVPRLWWIAAAATVAASGIWGTHFVGMLAYRPGLPIAYDLSLTLLSILVAGLLCGLGFRIALGRLGGAVGGAVAGAAISLMHFIGMAAVQMPARAAWSMGYVIAGIAIGVVLTAGALHFAVRRKGLADVALAVGLFVVAICGMHFTAMTAVTYSPDPTVPAPAGVIDPALLAIAVAAVSTLVVALGLMGSLIDGHLAGRSAAEAALLRAHIAELEETKLRLETTSAQLAEAMAETEAAADASAADAEVQAAVLERLANGLERLAAGQLTFRLADAFPPAYQKVRGDFNAAMDQLQAAMGEIRTIAFEIRAGGGEISQSALELSARTEQQAAGLEEAAANLGQITGAVRRTASGSAAAARVVMAAKVEAELSGQVVDDAVEAMGQISRSARQVAEIVGVIDEIAFQTNLLALNAGVEAARAGDAGRGFAVVATEVRALAQRSAGAAKEIQGLIATSGGQVRDGVQLVGKTGEALERIRAHVAEVDGLVAEFAAAAGEQAAGLNEVNDTVERIDAFTQQNAAMVEENTAASVALATQSHKLAQMIRRFDLGAAQGSDAVDRRSPPPRAA
jgi:methyl-accepting chemotaxis protein